LNPLAITYPKKRSIDSPIDKLTNKIFDSADGIFRGFSFGQDLDEIIAKERFKVFESEKEYVGVSFTNSKMETIDILYFRSVFNKLEKIQVEVFMNTEKDSDDIFDAFFFKIFEKNGYPNPIKDGFCWNRESEPNVSLKKVKNKLDQGVQLVFEK
jgi:hypothetical protein